MKSVSGTFQGKISGGGPDGSMVVVVAVIVGGIMFGGAVVAAVVAFFHLVLEAFTVIGALTVAAGVVYARIRYARRGNQPGPALACGHLATRKAVVTGKCSPCQAVASQGDRAAWVDRRRIPAGEIEPPRETHNHQHFYFNDPETAASFGAAAARSAQDQREAR